MHGLSLSILSASACAAHVQPFLGAGHPVLAYFPSHDLAILLPAAALVLGLSGVGAFVGYTMRKGQQKKKAV